MLFYLKMVLWVREYAGIVVTDVTPRTSVLTQRFPGVFYSGLLHYGVNDIFVSLQLATRIALTM